MKNKRFENWKQPEIDPEGWTKYGWRCQHPEKLDLGEYVDIGCFTYLNARYGIKIGKNVQIGSHCSVYSWSTIDDKKGKVTIKKNAKVGSHSVVTPGVTIGENCVIGAHSFVNKDIPANVMAWGTPIKVRKKMGNEK